MSVDLETIQAGLTIVGSTLEALAPIVALGGAVWLFFVQKNRERKDELRRERQLIYLEYLEALQNKKEQKDASMLSDGMLTAKVVMPFHDKLTIVAPDAVVVASLRFINAHIVSDFDRSPKPSSQRRLSNEEMEKHLMATEPLRETRKELIKAMRSDVLVGTKISEQLTDIEELERRAKEN